MECADRRSALAGCHPRAPARRRGGPRARHVGHGAEHAGPAVPPGPRPRAPCDVRRVPGHRCAARQGERHRLVVRRPDQHGRRPDQGSRRRRPGQLPHRVLDEPPDRVRLALPRPALGDGVAVRPAPADPPRDGCPGLRPGTRRYRHARPARPDLAGQRHGPHRHRVRPGRPRVPDARLRPLRSPGVVDVPLPRPRGLRRDPPSVRPGGAGLDRRARAARRLRQPAPVPVRPRHRAGRRGRVVGRVARSAALGRRCRRSPGQRGPRVLAPRPRGGPDQRVPRPGRDRRGVPAAGRARHLAPPLPRACPTPSRSPGTRHRSASSGPTSSAGRRRGRSTPTSWSPARSTTRS